MDLQRWWGNVTILTDLHKEHPKPDGRQTSEKPQPTTSSHCRCTAHYSQVQIWTRLLPNNQYCKCARKPGCAPLFPAAESLFLTQSPSQIYRSTPSPPRARQLYYHFSTCLRLQHRQLRWWHLIAHPESFSAVLVKQTDRTIEDWYYCCKA